MPKRSPACPIVGEQVPRFRYGANSAGADLGLPRGNVMHVEMSLDQMFGLRPTAGMANYRSHLKGLYLTGASTHPGGGIMGASGRNAARVLLKDLERRKV